MKIKAFLSNYADDNVLHASGSNHEEIKTHLSEDLTKISEWIRENFMILNPDEFHYMCLRKDNRKRYAKVLWWRIEVNTLETVLGTETD